MKETLQILIENLVDEPSLVKITENIKDNQVSYEVNVSEKDIGKVIGREGKITKNKQKVTIEYTGNRGN